MNNLNTPKSPLNHASLPRITIVGAGLSGLTAAYRLQEKGYSVEVFEALHRSGGRVLTAQIRESYEELGGKNFLDGGNPPNYTLQLFQELGLEADCYETSGVPLYRDAQTSFPLFEALESFPDLELLREKIQVAAKEAQNLQEVIKAVFQDPKMRLILEGLTRNYEGSEPFLLNVAL